MKFLSWFLGFVALWPWCVTGEVCSGCNGCSPIADIGAGDTWTLAMSCPTYGEYVQVNELIVNSDNDDTFQFSMTVGGYEYFSSDGSVECYSFANGPYFTYSNDVAVSVTCSNYIFDCALEKSLLYSCEVPPEYEEEWDQSCEFNCDNGNCVIYDWVCDYYDDCGDNSDEDFCFGEEEEEYCLNFECANGNCINEAYECDDDNDCGDGSDERMCPPELSLVCSQRTEAIAASSGQEEYMAANENNHPIYNVGIEQFRSSCEDAGGRLCKESAGATMNIDFCHQQLVPLYEFSHCFANECSDADEAEADRYFAELTDYYNGVAQDYDTNCGFQYTFQCDHPPNDGGDHPPNDGGDIALPQPSETCSSRTADIEYESGYGHYLDANPGTQDGDCLICDNGIEEYATSCEEAGGRLCSSTLTITYNSDDCELISPETESYQCLANECTISDQNEYMRYLQDQEEFFVHSATENGKTCVYKAVFECGIGKPVEPVEAASGSEMMDVLVVMNLVFCLVIAAAM